MNKYEQLVDALMDCARHTHTKEDAQRVLEVLRKYSARNELSVIYLTFTLKFHRSAIQEN